VRIPAAMCNRHGLIAGATGTGKTRTLQLLAEQLSAMGVPVFLSDIKGDLSGMSRPAEPDERVQARIDELGLSWAPQGHPLEYLALGGIGPGVPVRATVASFGAQLLAKVLRANATQSSSLSLVFRYAAQAGLELVDLADLRAVLVHLTSDEGKAELKAVGGLSSATAGVLLRSVSELQQQGADPFFGEPELDVADLLRVDGDGHGIISALELAAVQHQPQLFSTFLLWLLTRLHASLPEVGDLDKPRLVFFFDEAHLVFDDASEALLDQIAQTVRLIRSKGVGVFFITQLPDDVPDEVLAQLGNRVQHALRAFTPRDAKALKAAVTTFPNTSDYDLEEDLTRLAIGEAMVTILSERGAPTPVVWTRMRPPTSVMTALAAEEIDTAARASSLWARYAVALQRPSAAESLESRKPAEPGPTERSPRAERPKRPSKRRPSRGRSGNNAVVDYLKSREGRQLITRAGRGILDLLKKRR